jgi:hypothetical protein
MGKRFIIDCITILVSLINLGEEIGIYILQEVEDVKEEHKRYFFYTLFIIKGLDVFRCLSKNESYKTILSMVIDTLEVICYVTLLTQTSALFLVVFLTFGFEIVLNTLKVCLLHGSDSDDTLRYSSEPIPEKMWDCLALHVLRLFAYLVFQSTQLVFLFLQPDSKFRETYYEIITGWIHGDPNTFLEKNFLSSPAMWKRWKVAEKHF